MLCYGMLCYVMVCYVMCVRKTQSVWINICRMFKNRKINFWKKKTEFRIRIWWSQTISHQNKTKISSFSGSIFFWLFFSSFNLQTLTDRLFLNLQTRGWLLVLFHFDVFLGSKSHTMFYYNITALTLHNQSQIAHFLKWNLNIIIEQRIYEQRHF